MNATETALAAKINQELADLSARQSRVDEERRALRQNAINIVNQLIADFGLERGDLKCADDAPKAKAKSRRGGVREPKYEGPNGELWSGQGRTPLWLRAEEEKGRTRDEFLIRR